MSNIPPKTKYTSQYIDNMSFDDDLKVKLVEIINPDGTLANKYNFVQSEETATYKYYGFASATGWQIKRKTLATGVWEVASGTGDYATNWGNRATQTYGYF